VCIIQGCLSVSAWLAWIVHVICCSSADFSLCWLGTGVCCSSCVACWGSIPCSVPCSGPRTERACPYPSPKGWCRGSQGKSSEFCPSIPAGPYGCCCVCYFAWVVRSNLGGGLCAPQMWMMCVSMFPSVRLAALVFSCRLRCLRVGIGMYARPCARGVICDAFGAKAGFSPVRCCAALLYCILCLYWDSIPRACQALYFRVICPTAVRGYALWGGRRTQKMGFPAVIHEELQRWVDLSYDAHLVSAGLGRIRQPFV